MYNKQINKQYNKRYHHTKIKGVFLTIQLTFYLIIQNNIMFLAHLPRLYTDTNIHL